MANKWISDEEMRILIKRDEPMAMKRFYFTKMEHEPVDICPLCETVIALDKYNFCPVCGQRLDRENYAFQ